MRTLVAFRFIIELDGDLPGPAAQTVHTDSNIQKNADIFPPNSGRLVKAGTKINFNLHLNPRGEETPVRVAVAWKVFPKGAVPKYVAFTQHMGDVNDLELQFHQSGEF